MEGRMQYATSLTPSLLSPLFNFRGTADLDHGNITSQFGQTLLQLFLVVVRSCFFDLRPNQSKALGNAALNVSLLANAVDDGGVFRSLRARFARPNISKVTFSNLMPKSSEIT
jgi:hypothetical protein